jgi:hypothetical protein
MPTIKMAEDLNILNYYNFWLAEVSALLLLNLSLADFSIGNKTS